jgi:copper(I)-binding protein
MVKWLLLFLLPLVFTLPACNPASTDILTATDVWGRTSPASVQNAAFYFTLENSMGTDDDLVGAEVAICDRAELHETTIDGQGVMSMQHIQQINVANGATVRFEPGGLHLMCMGLKEELNAGDQIQIWLSFANSDDIQVEAEIRGP